RRRLLGPLQIMAATAIGATLSAPAAHAATPASSAEAATTPQPDNESHTTGGEAAVGEEPGVPQASESENGLVERTRTLDGFGHDSAELPEEAQADLDPVVEMIAGHAAAGVPVVVTGHTDATGDPDYNRGLSQRRAEAVAERLRARLGTAAPPIQARGLGSAAPLEEAGPQDAVQRRVEIAYTVTTTPPPEPPPSGEEEREPPPADAAPEGAEENGRPVVVVEVPSAAGVAGAAVAAGVAGFWAGRRGRPAHHDDHDHDERDRTAEPEPEAGWEREPEEAVLGGDSGPGWRHEAPDLPHTPEHRQEEPEPGDEPASETAAPPPPGTRVEVARLPGAVGLTGAGAAGPARTALAAARHGLPVSVPAAALERLLGAAAAHRIHQAAPPAVTITHGLDDATSRLHTEMLTRLDEPDDEEGDRPGPLLAPDASEE